jgi:hypothetical protein
LIPAQWASSVRRQEYEDEHASPSSAEVKNAWSYTSIPPYFIVVWCLIEHRDNFTFEEYYLLDYNAV